MYIGKRTKRGEVMKKRIRKKKGIPFKKVRYDELVNLDYTISKFVHPRLVRFREEAVHGYPVDFDSLEDWQDVLDKMIWSFGFMAGGGDVTISADLGPAEDYEKNYCAEEHTMKTVAAEKRCQEGLDLFAKHMGSLWL